MIGSSMPRLLRQSARIFLVVSALGHPGEVSTSIRITVTSASGARLCSRRFPLGERFKLDVIADGFNLTNRLNVAAVNQLCDPGSGTTCAAGQPTAAYDARQFQFALKLLF